MAKYIDAEAAVETFRLWFERIGVCPSFGDVQKIIPQVPAADVAPVIHAHWIPKQQIVRSPYARNYVCSNCAHEPLEAIEYCPKCGAKMDGEATEHG